MRTDVLVNVDHLLAAKHLVRSAGNHEAARTALWILAELAELPGPTCQRVPLLRSTHRRGRSVTSSKRVGLVCAGAAAIVPPAPAVAVAPAFERHVDACLAERVEQRRGTRTRRPAMAPAIAPLENGERLARAISQRDAEIRKAWPRLDRSSLASAAPLPPEIVKPRWADEPDAPPALPLDPRNVERVLPLTYKLGGGGGPWKPAAEHRLPNSFVQPIATCVGCRTELARVDIPCSVCALRLVADTGADVIPYVEPEAWTVPPVGALGLTVRTQNALEEAGYLDVHAVARIVGEFDAAVRGSGTKATVIAINGVARQLGLSNCGPKVVEELRQALARWAATQGGTDAGPFTQAG